MGLNQLLEYIHPFPPFVNQFYLPLCNSVAKKLIFLGREILAEHLPPLTLTRWLEYLKYSTDAPVYIIFIHCHCICLLRVLWFLPVNVISSPLPYWYVASSPTIFNLSNLQQGRKKHILTQ